MCSIMGNFYNYKTFPTEAFNLYIVIPRLYACDAETLNLEVSGRLGEYLWFCAVSSRFEAAETRMATIQMKGIWSKVETTEVERRERFKVCFGDRNDRPYRWCGKYFSRLPSWILEIPFPFSTSLFLFLLKGGGGDTMFGQGSLVFSWPFGRW